MSEPLGRAGPRACLPGSAAEGAADAESTKLPAFRVGGGGIWRHGEEQRGSERAVRRAAVWWKRRRKRSEKARDTKRTEKAPGTDSEKYI